MELRIANVVFPDWAKASSAKKIEDWVFEAYLECPRPCTIKEIAKGTSLSEATVRKNLTFSKTGRSIQELRVAAYVPTRDLLRKTIRTLRQELKEEMDLSQARASSYRASLKRNKELRAKNDELLRKLAHCN
jgi:hypothetical protein